MAQAYIKVITRALFLGFSEFAKDNHIDMLRQLFDENEFLGNRGETRLIIFGIDFIDDDKIPKKYRENGHGTTRCIFTSSDGCLMVSAVVSRLVVSKTEEEFRVSLSDLFLDMTEKLNKYCKKKGVNFGGDQLETYVKRINELYFEVPLPLGPSACDMHTVAVRLGII